MIRPTILLAEPDEALAAWLRFTLELQGYSVFVVQPADLQGACLDLLGRVCLVLGERPRSSATLELAISLVGKGCPLPIVVLTTNPTRATVERSRAHSIALIEKPRLGEVLGNVLHELLEVRDAA